MANTQAFFLPAAPGHAGQRFCLFHAAQSTVVRGSVLYVHPFAEEMNKSRRMAAMQARALSAAGYAVLQIDLYGCGDSSGDLGDAGWDDWVNDVLLGCAWLRRQDASGAPLWLWGLRAGCLLAAAAAPRIEGDCNFLLWQPPSSGKPLLQQFMRLKVAGDLMGGNAKGIMDGMRQQWAAGEPVEIAGYAITPSLASGLEQAALAAPGSLQRAEWFELSTREDAALAPISAKTVEQWQQAGATVAARVVNGPAFWQTAEIEEASSLIEATTAAMVASTSAIKALAAAA